MIAAVKFHSDNIYIRFDNTVYLQIVDISMGTYCASLIADLFLYYYESQYMAKFEMTLQNRIKWLIIILLFI